MNRVYNKSELLSCAGNLVNGDASVIGTIGWALNAISEIAENNAKALVKWTKYFTKKGIAPSVQITKEEEFECIKLFNQYKTEQASYQRYEENLSSRAAQLVVMMDAMRQAQA